MASIAKSPVVLLAQHSHDSDDMDHEDFHSVGSIGKTADGEKVASGNNEDSDDGKTADAEKVASGNNENSDDEKTGNKEDSDDDLLNRVANVDRY